MAPNPNNGGSNDSYVKKLVFMFGLVYFAQGLAQASGLISQPLSFYMKEVLHFDEAQSTSYLAVLTLPWIIKPLYGLVSDFIPLFGYRRKSWLLLLNVISAGAFFWLTGLDEPSKIVFALLLTAFGTAASDVIVDALMVENGQKFNMVGKFQSVQWFWFYAAQIATSLAGGWLASMSDPGTGLHVAAMITMFAAVAQRVGEIGTLRALGFRRGAVLVAFLLESLLLSLVGGVVGLALGTMIDNSSIFNTGSPSGAAVSTGAPVIIGFRFRNEGADLASADVILNALARRQQTAPPPPILTPERLTLAIAPLADCARYDTLRGAGDTAARSRPPARPC